MKPVPDGPLNFPFPDQLPEQTYPVQPDEPAPIETRELDVQTRSAPNQRIVEPIDVDAVRKSWAEMLVPVAQKPPHRGASEDAKREYNLMLTQIYKRMSRLMRSDLDEPGVGP